MEPEKLAYQAANVASDKEATDIILLDIRKLNAFTDFFVILSGDTHRRLDALAEDIAHVLKVSGAKLHHREGSPQSGWVILDFGDIVVHLFGPEERAYYQLEELWFQGHQMLRIL